MKNFFSIFSDLSGISNNATCNVFDLNKIYHKSVFKAARSFKNLTFQFYQFKDRSESSYFSSDQIPTAGGEVVILSGNALLNAIARYPYRAKYVIYHVSILDFRFYLGVFGLFRRHILGLKSKNARIHFIRFSLLFAPVPQLFLIIKNNNADINTHFSVSSEVGYKGFLEFLKSTNKKYCVVRFFENLPHEYRQGGDLDIIVEDDLYKQAGEFLEINSGEKMIDMYSVTGPASSARIPYYTPFLSKKILDESVDYRGYKVPTRENYLNSFIYHCLYHKGLSSGIMTKYSSLLPSPNPDNNYLEKIRDIARPLSINPGNTLEELDSYMQEVGWKPHIDTLELLSTSNKWINVHLKNSIKNPELTLIMCVLKSGFHDNSTVDSFYKELNRLGFSVLHHESLKGERKQYAYNHLRGGNWSSTNELKYSPSDIFILKGNTFKCFAARVHNFPFDPRPVKMALRRKFDFYCQSTIHMTDNTDQSLEYIDLMYPDMKKQIIETILEKDSNRLNSSQFIFVRTIVYKFPSLLSLLIKRIIELPRSII